MTDLQQIPAAEFFCAAHRAPVRRNDPNRSPSYSPKIAAALGH
jgi:hypothetical protein